MMFTGSALIHTPLKEIDPWWSVIWRIHTRENDFRTFYDWVFTPLLPRLRALFVVILCLHKSHNTPLLSSSPPQKNAYAIVLDILSDISISTIIYFKWPQDNDLSRW